MAAAAAAAAGTGVGPAADVDTVVGQIRALNIRYRNVVDKLTAIKGAKDKAEETLEQLALRHELKEAFINKKQAARGLIALIKATDGVLAAAKDRDLKAALDDFRALDGEFFELGVLADREALFEGAAKRADALTTNSALLDGALATQKDTTAVLVGAVATIEATKVVAAETMGTLAADHDKIEAIDEHLDAIHAELEISQRLIVGFVKRVFTDRIILAVGCLVILGILAIIIYAAVNPSQEIFAVPDEVKPPIPPP